MPPSGLSWRALSLLYGSATLAAWWVGPDGPVYWDSFGYVTQAVTGRVGALMLGRPTFVLGSHAAVSTWRALGGSLWQSEPLLRVLWTLVSALGAPALAWVTFRAGASERAAVASGVFLALSPSVAHTSHAVLTDAPSMAVTLVAFGVGVRAASSASLAQMFLSGAALGVAAGLREQAALHVVTLMALAWTAPRRRLALALLAALGCVFALGAPVAWVAAHQPTYMSTLREWARSMASERTQHPYGLRDLAMFFAWLAASGPIALALASMAAFTRWRRSIAWTPRLMALVIPSAVQLAALAFYQDIAFSPRYLLPALPCAVMLPAGLVFDAVWREGRGRWLMGAVVFTALVAGGVMRRVERPLRDGLRTLPARLATVPRDAAIVTGQLCPAVVYQRELSHLAGDATPRWVQVCPGWRWPTDLGARLDGLRAQGHAVVIDLRDDSWVGVRQRACQAEAASYARSHSGDVSVWR